jgi:putative tricarboxylic transport membrane protein
VAFVPGGGVDGMSRKIAELLTTHQLYPAAISVTNRAGGSGSKGYGYVFGKKGSGYDLAATSGSFISTPIEGSTPWRATQFTPLALLGTDENIIWVRKDAPWTNLEQFIAAARKRAPAIAGAGATTVDFIALKQLSEQAGFKFNYVANDSGAEAANALLAGSVQALSHSAGGVYGLYKSGDLRPLAIGGEKRLSTLPNTPTLAELGYKVTINQPRGLVMPPDVSPEVAAWWSAALHRVAQLPEWQAYMEANFISPRELYGPDFAKYLDELSAAYNKALKG